MWFITRIRGSLSKVISMISGATSTSHWIDEEPQNEELVEQLVEEAEEFLEVEFSQEFDEDEEEEGE